MARAPDSRGGSKWRLGGLELAILLTLGLAALIGAQGLSGSDDSGVSSDRQDAAAVRRPTLGAAVEWDRLRRPGLYQGLFLAHYSSLTPENAMKMDALAPTPGGFDFREADALVGWAIDHGIAVHGHTLVWHRQLPAWLTERRWTRSELRAYLRRYITAVVRHFRGRVASWDVVNEPLTAGGSPRRSIWQRVLGEAYVDDALRWAHAADPRAKLYVNDFDLERPGPKSAAMHRLLEGLRSRQVPLDGIGLQAHLTPRWRPTGQGLNATMRRYANLGLQVDISELDVPVGREAGALAEQARIYRMVAASCRRLPVCGRFTTWGFTDASTWLGSARRPLPFSAAGNPKPAWRAIADELLP
jgi:endo-1,4-beta-xylanase